MSRTDDRQANFEKAVGRIEQAANASFVATVNRVGFEQAPDGSGGIQFWGGSFIADLSGQVAAKASMEEEENLLYEIDFEQIEKLRNTSSYPFRDRRVDSYQDLTKLYSS
jgi:N-carbamoylputrescine amidase